MSVKILIVDDEELIRWSLSHDLGSSGYKVVVASNLNDAIQAVEREAPDVVLTDLRLGPESGLDVLKAARRHNPELPVIIMTAFADLDSAVEALREGAVDYISKPIELAGLKITLKRVLEAAQLKRRYDRAQQKSRDHYNFASIVAESHAMKEALAMARKIAESPFGSVLLLGESGCGKDRLARAIHFGSARAQEPFMEISCTAIPEHLLESELFGYEKGAFTGAAGQKKGLFELADGGTVFLNEIGHMPMSLQGKLLRALEDKTFKRLGGRDDITVDVRIMAATNEDLAAAVAEKRFRQDLFYRINVVAISLRPLRERREDILPLVDVLLDRLSVEMMKLKPKLSLQTRQNLQTYEWPGNVRELRNVLERMLILDDYEFRGQAAISSARTEVPKGESGQCGRLEDMEKEMIRQALESSGGNQQKAAESLGLSRDALRRRIQKFGLKAGLCACLIAVLSLGATAAGWFGGGKKTTADAFKAAHEEEATQWFGKPSAHSPVRSGSCSSCHTDPADPAKLKFEQKPLCLSCHTATAAELKKPVVHSAFGDMECSTCHKPHESEQPALLTSAVNELCLGCHDTKDDAIKKSHFGIREFESSCTRCHSPHASENAKLIRELPEHVPFASRSCEMCHAKTGSDGKAGLKDTPKDTCFVCHSNFRALDQNPVVHAPFASGDCAVCHDPHMSQQASMLRRPVSDVCFGCHEETLKDAHPVARHPTAREAKADPRRKGKQFNCVSCHDPHASKNEKMLRLPTFTALCEECHGK